MAIVSMTGFGRGEASAGGVKSVVELSTVNRKQFDCNFSMPRELASLDSKLQALVHTRVSMPCRSDALNSVRGPASCATLTHTLLLPWAISCRPAHAGRTTAATAAWSTTAASNRFVARTSSAHVSASAAAAPSVDSRRTSVSAPAC